MQIVCQSCQKIAQSLDWCCTQCGGILEFDSYPTFNPDHIIKHDNSLWRYRDWLPIEPVRSLGAGMTPLTETIIDSQPLLIKMEYLNPTGSYKDRGTTLVLNHFAAQGITEVVEDSSGNAGASVAAYSSTLGIRATIFVPAAGGQTKKLLIQTLGGNIVAIEGAQAARTAAARKAAQTTPYASHAYNPYFILGQMTVAFEVWEETKGNLPDFIITPIGQGSLFLGFYRGFQVLQAAGLIDNIPTMIAVQAAACDPIVRAFDRRLLQAEKVEAYDSLADGIRVNAPLRSAAILSAIRETDGAAYRITEADIAYSQYQLWQHGFICEPTSAVTLAAIAQLKYDYDLTHKRILLALTGNGLKMLDADDDD